MNTPITDFNRGVIIGLKMVQYGKWKKYKLSNLKIIAAENLCQQRNLFKVFRIMQLNSQIQVKKIFKTVVQLIRSKFVGKLSSMNQYQARNRQLQKSSNIWDMSNYAEIGFTSQNIKKNMFQTGLEAVETNIQIQKQSEEKKMQREQISREELIKLVYNKDQCELSELEKLGIEGYYKDLDRDDSKMKAQAMLDYDLKETSFIDYTKKRFNQAMDKNPGTFIAGKVKEVMIYPFQRVFDAIGNIFGKISNFFSSIPNYLILAAIGFVFVVIFIKKI